ncbi:MAG: T9SS type A sorting domain-containing protein [Bacteroidetes bacterium]|nr:T9SS type A sorting domain-containing protein [Bacteroidota bacterium]
MNMHLKKNSTLLILWFLFASLSLHHAVAQYAVSYYGESGVKTSNFTDFKITTWNVEWLSCLTNGPKDRELQINNVVSMIKTMNSDLVALQEVGTSNMYTTIDTLVKRLGSEWEGEIVPWNTNNCSQNQGIVYKKSKVNFINASLIKDGGSSYSWASGRFPALYEVNLVVDNRQIPISFINIHAKAFADEVSYTRRRDASIGLKDLLDGSAYNTKRIVIIGDFNDYLKGTICYTCGGISPYKNFMDDINNYRGITANLNTVDHIIISNELFDNYLNNSIFREFSATQTIPNYYTTTSDHIPTSVTFRMTEDLSIVDFPERSFYYVYPNPTTGQLTIKSEKIKIENIAIFDIYGRKLSFHHLITTSSDYKIDISSYPAGIYFLQINGETMKVVKH